MPKAGRLLHLLDLIRDMGRASVPPAGQRLSYRVDEIPSLTGVPLTTVRKEIKAGMLVTASLNAKVTVVLKDDVLKWLNGYRSVPATPEEIDLLKKKQALRTSRSPIQIPGRAPAREAQRQRYERIKRQLAHDQ